MRRRLRQRWQTLVHESLRRWRRSQHRHHAETGLHKLESAKGKLELLRRAVRWPELHQDLQLHPAQLAEPRQPRQLGVA